MRSPLNKNNLRGTEVPLSRPGEERSPLLSGVSIQGARMDALLSGTIAVMMTFAFLMLLYGGI